MKPLIWKGEPPQLIYCEPEKGCVMKLEMIGKTCWYHISYKGKSMDSFFGKTAYDVDQAKSICAELYEKYKKGESPKMLLQNNLP